MNVFERKYCIIDCAGNYYTVNENDNLVVAESEETAEWFDILEANKRINNSGMSKSLRTVAANKSKLYQKKKETECDDDEFKIEEIDFEFLAKELAFIQSHIGKYQTELKKKQTAIDEEICDIMHYIELYERDEDENLDLVDKLYDCRIRRRKIKDKHYVAETFARLFASSGNSNLIKDINKQMVNMEKREYIPRRLHSLFVQGVKLSEAADEEAYYEEIEDLEEEQTMSYERQQTIFDDKSMDWGALVTEQAIVFENIQQHIINLQIDIANVDDEIEKIMEICEETSCNVTQGYKMFKQLKDLRLVRKDKMEELDTVQRIAQCFDCPAMADAYRYLANHCRTDSSDKVVELAVSESENKETIKEAI